MSTETPKYQIMPPLTEEEEAALEKSILDNGVLVPIIVDENSDITYGPHRKKIADKHKLPCKSAPVLRDNLVAPVTGITTDAEKIAMALTLNLDRRHLTREQKRELLARSIK